MTAKAWSDLLISSTQEMFAQGLPMMSRVLPDDAVAEIWTHYPDGDVVNGAAGSRYFYHCHPPGERGEGEHGHFHLFLAKSAMPQDAVPLRKPPKAGRKERRADVVHIAALSISTEGLPLAWFTTNRWVTDEWLYPAPVVASCLDRFDLRGDDGDPLVNAWITAITALSRPRLIALLAERDRVLAAQDPTGEDRQVEIASHEQIMIENLLTDMD